MAKSRFTQNELQIICQALLMTNGIFDLNSLPSRLKNEEKVYSAWENALRKVIERIRR